MSSAPAYLERDRYFEAVGDSPDGHLHLLRLAQPLQLACTTTSYLMIHAYAHIRLLLLHYNTFTALLEIPAIFLFLLTGLRFHLTERLHAWVSSSWQTLWSWRHCIGVLDVTCVFFITFALRRLG
jgi:hypothetical protein